MNSHLLPKAFYFALSLFFASTSMVLAANFFEEGKKMYEIKQFEQAKQCFEAEITHHPENAAAHYLLANVFVELKQTEKAQQEYQKSVQLDPTGTAGRYSRLALDSISSNPQVTKADNNQSLSQAPANSPSSDKLAAVYSSKKISKEVTKLVEQEQNECDAKVKALLAEADDKVN